MNKKEVCLIGYFLIFFAFCWGIYFAVFFTSSPTQNSTTLELIHVIMRHGDRNPDKVSIGLLSPYLDEKYYAEGYGQLHKTGIIRAHQVGSYLRSRYNNFLGPTWNIKYVEARTSDYNRTKMSLQLALAGLYPPIGSQMWSSIYWQPIPYNYVPKLQDKELLPYYTCPRYTELVNNIYEEPSIKKYLLRYEETFRILENKTLRKMDPESAFYLYVGFQIQEQLGYPLEEWTKTVYPEPLHAEMIDFYHLITNTTEIRRIIAGYFLKKLLTDTEAKINGTINPPERKLFFYSGHEINIAAILLTLDAQEGFELPPFSSFVIFEVHKIEGVYGIKLFYQNYKQADPVLLKIKGCDYFCPFNDLYRIVEKYLPEDDEECFASSSSIS